MQPLLLGIVGEKSSGKSNVFQYLSTKPGVFSVRMSDYLRDVLKMLQLDIVDRNNYARLGEALRRAFGADVIPRAILNDPRARRSRVVVIEGIRRLAELKPLRRKKNFRLLYLTAPVEIRWKRARRRTRAKRDDDNISLKAYQRVERTLITEREIPAMGRLADIRIDNTGTKSDLCRQVDVMLRQLTKNK